MWAITCYFNPMGYRRRLVNFRAFRRALGLPLVAVELSYDGTFVLTDDDADTIVRMRARDVMWQKEHLLGVALAAVPADCRKVAWVDADLAFARDDWAAEAETRLDDTPLLQLMGAVRNLPESSDPERPDFRLAGPPEPTFGPKLAAGGRDGLVRALTTGPEQQQRIGMGLGWAFRRELYETRGFYPYGIVGGGDALLLCAAWGEFEAAVGYMRMTEARRRHYLEWAEPVYEEVRGALGYIDGVAYHFWHGAIVDRRYRGRHESLARYDFDPAIDIAVDETTGALRWNSDKPQMHAFVREWFAGRREDGAESPVVADETLRGR